MHTLFDLRTAGKVVGDYGSGFGDLCKVPRILAHRRGKVFDRRLANPCSEGNAQARRHKFEAQFQQGLIFT